MNSSNQQPERKKLITVRAPLAWWKKAKIEATRRERSINDVMLIGASMLLDISPPRNLEPAARREQTR